MIPSNNKRTKDNDGDDNSLPKAILTVETAESVGQISVSQGTTPSSGEYTPLSSYNSPNGFFSGLFGNQTRRRRRKDSHFTERTSSNLTSSASEYFSEDELDSGKSKIPGFLRNTSLMLRQDFQVLKSLLSSKTRHHYSFNSRLCSFFRLSVALFACFTLFLCMNGSLAAQYGFKSKFGMKNSGKNFWENYDKRWKKAHKLDWKQLQELMPAYDFRFLANSSYELKLLRTINPKKKMTAKQKLMKTVEESYTTKYRQVFPPNQNYLTLKSTDLIQIKRPAVRTKRADEARATRTFGCVRDGCRGLAIEDLLDRGWQMRFRAAENNDTFKDINYRVTFLLTDTTHLTVLNKRRPDIFKRIYSNYAGKCYLSAFDGGDAIGGNKGQQIQVKEKFVRNYGCKFNDLNIAPKSYRLYRKEECEDLMSQTTNRELTWILKPETGSQGSGITFHNDVKSVMNKVPRFFPCKQYKKGQKLKATERYLVQQYLSKPLLLKKSKFDVRVYMLIASSTPYLVFYHEGYLRRSLAEYDPNSKDRKVYLTNTHFQSMKKNFKLSEHIWPFSMMQDHLSTHGRTGSHYVETILNPYIKKVANFIFHTAREKFVKRKGTFHVFGIDFMIDADYHVWFIEANGYPGFTWSLNFDSRSMVEEMFNLVQQVHENPRFYMLMQPGDRFGGFEMVFNELEEERARKHALADQSMFDFKTRGLYNPCLEFRHNLGMSKPLKTANRLLAKFSGKEGRTDKIKNFDHFIPNVINSVVQPASAHENQKLWILKAETEHLKQDGCKRSKLRYTPLTYILENDDECLKFFEGVNVNEGIAEEDADSDTPKPLRKEDEYKWVLKTQQSTQIFATKQELYPLYGACENNKGVIAQKLVENRLLFNNKWWDMKVFFLISNTQPYLVWYHHGYLRSSKIHLNKALKETADQMLKQSRRQQAEEKAKTVETESEADAQRAEFTVEELLVDLEEELGFPVSRITKEGAQQQPKTGADEQSTGGFNIAGLKNVHFSLNNNLEGDDGIGLFEEEKWEPDEYSTGSVWSVGDNFWTFSDFEDKMAKEMMIGSQYVDSVFDAYVKRVVNMIFRSIKDKKNRTANAFELYEANFILDEHYVFHYLGAKAVDPESAFPNVEDEHFMEEKATFMKQMAELVLETTAAPAAFARMLRGDSFGNWRLVFSELEELQRQGYNAAYKPCEEFKRNLMVHKGSIYKNAWLHNYADKRHAANKREMNKYIHTKWGSCKYKQSRELMSSCIRNTISYRYKIYIQKEGIEYQDGYVENRIRDLIAKREAESRN